MSTCAPADEVARQVRRPGGLDEVARQVRRACLDTGFFHIVGHGVEEALIAEAFRQHRGFHARSVEEKLALRINHWHRGYEPFATSKLTSSARFEPARHANRLESFFIRHEVPETDPGYRVKALMGPNQWPGDAAFRDVITRYDRALRELGTSLLAPLSLAVGEDRDYLARFFDPPSTALRLVHYPPGPADRPADMLGIQPHTDYGFLTILAQDEVEGLEIRRLDGTWIRPPRVPGGFIVNVGDALARWTNDVFNSTPHRVVADPRGRDRYSIAMFFDPDIEAEIRCLDGFTQDGEGKYEPIRYGAYFQDRLDSNFPDRVGKDGEPALEQYPNGSNRTGSIRSD